jgi:hypothetical protein
MQVCVVDVNGEAANAVAVEISGLAVAADVSDSRQVVQADHLEMLEQHAPVRVHDWLRQPGGPRRVKHVKRMIWLDLSELEIPLLACELLPADHPVSGERWVEVWQHRRGPNRW